MTRYLFCFLLSAAIQGKALAQEPTTTVLKYPLRSISFGAPMLELSSIQGQAVLSVGGIGGVIVNKRLVFGGFGQIGNATLVLSDNHPYRTSISQGGVMLGYIVGYQRPIHLLTNLRLGWGSHTFKDITTRQQFDQNSINVTPYVGTEMNVTHFLRIQLLGGYRVVLNSGLSQPTALLPFELNSVVGTLALSFGIF